MVKLSDIDTLICDLREMKKTAVAFEKARTSEISGGDFSAKRRVAIKRRADENAMYMLRLEYEFHCKLVDMAFCDPYPASYYGGEFLQPMGAFGDIASMGKKRIPERVKMNNQQPKATEEMVGWISQQADRNGD